MKIQVKVFILLTIVLGITIFSIGIFQYIEIERQKIFLRSAEENRDLLIDNVLNFNKKKYFQVARDYSAWDDMIEFLKKLTPEWANLYLITVIPTYDLDYLWIYSLTDSVVYSVSKKGLSSITALPVSNIRLKAITEKNTVFHFFFVNNDNIIEVFGNGIVPTSDIFERKTSPKGFFFAGKLWDKKYIRELENFSDSKIILDTLIKDVPSDNNEFIINDFRYCNNWEGNKILKITFTKSAVHDMERVKLMHYSLYTVIILSLIFLFLFFIFLRNWISVPLNKISLTLNTNDLQNLDTLINKSDEFGTIARLIRKFFTLNIQMRNEMENRLQAEHALIKSEEKYRSIFENSSLGIFRTTLDGKFLTANHALAKITGFEKPEDLMNSISSIAILYNNPGKRQEIISQVITSDSFISFENQFLCKNGKINIIQLYMHKVHENDNTYLEGFIEDITERKKIENELINAKEKAEESDRLKSAFIANMSHEIRTPLNAILGFSELLSELDVSNKLMETYTTIIKRRSYDLLNIINDILDISIIDTGLLKIVEERGDLNLLLKDVYNFFEFQDDSLEKNAKVPVKIISEVNDIAGMIQADFNHIRQVLINLITNSMKFTKTGFIEFGCRLSNDQNLLFWVKDTGIGIPREKSNIVFERFRQVDDNFLAKEYGGTGLGLTISKAIVELMKGNIWFESEINIGTTFYFTIPYKPASHVYTFLPVANDSAINLQSKHILVVEDDLDNIQYVKKVLSETKVNFLTASNGNIALEMIDQTPEIDLVLVDIRLPDINGYEIIKYIKSKRPGLIVIAQTAYASESDKQKCFEAGCDNYISKPIKRKLLLQIIQQYFNKTNHSS